MPRTKNKGKPTPRPPAANGGLRFGEVLTLPEAAAYLRLGEADLLRLVRDQGLPGRQVGNEWRFFKAALQQWLSTPTPRGGQEGIWAAMGSWKDDPYLEELLKEIYRRRGRPMTEEG